MALKEAPLHVVVLGSLLSQETFQGLETTPQLARSVIRNGSLGDMRILASYLYLSHLPPQTPTDILLSGEEAPHMQDRLHQFFNNTIPPQVRIRQESSSPTTGENFSFLPQDFSVIDTVITNLSNTPRAHYMARAAGIRVGETKSAEELIYKHFADNTTQHNTTCKS